MVRVCASVRSFMRNCTKLFGTDFSGCWREALVMLLLLLHISFDMLSATVISGPNK